MCYSWATVGEEFSHSMSTEVPKSRGVSSSVDHGFSRFDAIVVYTECAGQMRLQVVSSI